VGRGGWDALLGASTAWFHLPQLRELGVPEHFARARVRATRWYPLYRGVYAVGHAALGPKGRLLAAVLACGPEALASHRAAAGLHGLIYPGWIEVTAARGCKPKPGITIHRSRLGAAEHRTLIAAVPVTTVARTIVDLADVFNEKRLAGAVRQAENLRIFDLQAIRAVQARLPGRTGRHRLERVLAPTGPSRTSCAARRNGN
jgi:hypothetical protein